MNEIFESLKPILGLLGLSFTILSLFAGWKLMRNIKTMDQKSTDELKAIIEDPRKRFTFGAAIKELRERNEDYSKVLPHLLDMSISKSSAERLIGWGVLDANFPEVTKEIEFDPMKPSKNSLHFLKSLKESWVTSR